MKPRATATGATPSSPRSGRWPGRCAALADLDPLVDAARRQPVRLHRRGLARHPRVLRVAGRAEPPADQEHGFTWIGVEGDWPDCWRINRWVRGHERPGPRRGGGARPLRALADVDVGQPGGRRLPRLAARVEPRQARARRVGFYGLDVYSLWDSLREIIVVARGPRARGVPAAMRAWQCFLPYGEDPHEYAWSTRLVPESCEADVVALLVEVRRRTRGRDGEAAFDAAQNAEVAADAEHYYRTMVRGDRRRGTSATTTWPTPSTGCAAPRAAVEGPGVGAQHPRRRRPRDRHGRGRAGQRRPARPRAARGRRRGARRVRRRTGARSSPPRAGGARSRCCRVPPARAGQPRGPAAPRPRRTGAAGLRRRQVRPLALGPAGPPRDRRGLPAAARVRQLRARR